MKINVPLMKKTLILASPVLVSFITGSFMFIMTGSMIASQGKGAIAAVGVVLLVYTFITAGLEGFFESTMILLSRAWGAKDKEQFKKYFIHELLLAVVIGTALIFLYFPVYYLLSFLSNDMEVIAWSRKLFLILSFTFPFYALSWVLNRFLMSIQRPRPILVFTNLITANTVLFHWLFIFGKLGFPKMGLYGVAVATMLPFVINVIAAGIYIFMIYNKIMKTSEAAPFKFEIKTAKEIVKIGIHIMQASLFEVGGWLVFAGNISKLGVLPMSAHELSMRLKNITYYPIAAMGSVTLTLTGEAHGQQNIKRIKEITETVLCILLPLVGSACLAAFIFPGFFVKLFTQDKELIEYTSTILRIVIIAPLFDILIAVYKNALNGLGDVVFVKRMFLIGCWGLMVPLSIVLSRMTGLGVSGSWISFVIYLGLLSTVFIFRYSYLMRKNAGIIDNARGEAKNFS